MKKLICICVLMAAGIVAASTNEIQELVNLTVNKDALRLTRTPDALNIQMAGNKWNTEVIYCTSTNTAFSKGSVANLGFAFVQNLSTNVNVYISYLGSTNMMLKPREYALWRYSPTLTITNFQAATISGAANLEHTVIED